MNQLDVDVYTFSPIYLSTQMRARRLRRLGIQQPQSSLMETQTINETLSKPNDVALDGQKNKISSSTHGSIEADENEHKQKQIKFDEDIDVRQKKETIWNNNEQTRKNFSLVN